MTALAQSSLVARWRQRFGGQRRNRARPRPVAALGYLVHGPVIENLVEIENLVLVVLYDEPQPDGRLALRLAGFSGARMPWGIAWGGPQQSKFFKDLLLRPVSGARGLRLDASRARLPQLAMKTEQSLAILPPRWWYRRLRWSVVSAESASLARKAPVARSAWSARRAKCPLRDLARWWSPS